MPAVARPFASSRARNYPAQDALLPDELGEIVAESGVSVREAHVLRVARSRLRNRTRSQNVCRRWSRMAGLMPQRVVMGDHAQTQQRVLRMLQAIFEGLAVLTRRSGTMSAVTKRPA